MSKEKDCNVIELHSYISNSHLTESDMEKMFPISASVTETQESVRDYPMFSEAENCVVLYNSIGMPLAITPILDQDNISILRWILVSKVLEKHGFLYNTLVGADAHEFK